MPQFELFDANGTQLLNFENMLLTFPYVGPRHHHPSLELSFIKSGTGLYEIDGQTYELKKGDIVIINNVEEHHIMLRQGEHLLNAVIHFEPELIWNTLQCDMDYRFLQIFFERNENFSHVISHENPNSAIIYQLLEEIEQEFIEKKNCYDLMIKIKLQSVLANIIRYFDYCTETTKEKIPNRDIHMMAGVIAYIKDHLTENITLEELGRVTNMSPNYFSTLFKRYNGVSPFEYIITQRVYRAITMIHNSDRTLTDIAFSCGFNNTSAFVKAFRRVTGNPPSYYRSNK